MLLLTRLTGSKFVVNDLRVDTIEMAEENTWWSSNEANKLSAEEQKKVGSIVWMDDPNQLSSATQWHYIVQETPEEIHAQWWQINSYRINSKGPDQSNMFSDRNQKR